MDLGLRGKTALVMGGTRGLGRSTATLFAQEGMNTAICARNAEAVDSTLTHLRTFGVGACGIALDVKDRDAVTNFVDMVADRFGTIDALVLNVSAQSYDLAKCFDIDLSASVHTVDSTVPFMRSSGGGAIVAIASKAASLAVPSYKSYSAMKAALLSYMASLSRELAPFQIRVNSVSPGEIYSEPGFWSRIRHEDPELYERALRGNPSGRFAAPEEVGRAVVFLASSAASFISGTNLMVDYAAHEHVQF